MRLEAAAWRHSGPCRLRIPFAVALKGEVLFINWREAFALLADTRAVLGREAEWALAVHRAVADAALTMLRCGLSVSKQRTVALSGGVFMNRILCDLLAPELEALGVKVLMHRQTPPNDGCISVGQALAAGARALV